VESKIPPTKARDWEQSSQGRAGGKKKTSELAHIISSGRMPSE
jgi:hypothetical protein